MGLDVTAYKKITRQDLPLEEDGYEYDYVRAFVNPDFPGRADDLTDSWYSYEDAVDGISCGYGGYNHWRRELAKLAGWQPAPFEQYGRVEMREDAAAWAADGGPFWELINFTDCDGAIGTAIAAKLAKDFAEHQSKADEHPDKLFRARYEQMRKAFECAADSGFVRFH
jgi:hypothetical protein